MFSFFQFKEFKLSKGGIYFAGNNWFPKFLIQTICNVQKQRKTNFARKCNVSCLENQMLQITFLREIAVFLRTSYPVRLSRSTFFSLLMSKCKESCLMLMQV